MCNDPFSFVNTYKDEFLASFKQRICFTSPRHPPYLLCAAVHTIFRSLAQVRNVEFAQLFLFLIVSASASSLSSARPLQYAKL